jgi:nitrogen fixation NifU-like protein
MNEDLYHAAILEAARRGALDRRLASPASTATVDNPLCGDRVTIDLDLADGAVARIGYRVRGCALCQAATALLAEAAHGHPVADIAVGESLVRALIADGLAPPGSWNGFAMFAPVRRFPSRHGCVLIPFEAFHAAAKR